MYSCSLYARASSIALLLVFLGACSTANGLDMIAADVTAPAKSAVTSVASDDEPDIPVNAYAAPEQPPALASTSFEANGAISRVQANSPELHALIARYSSHYDVPERLVHRVVKRESNYDPAARNKIYWGLMQIRHDTAQTMGYRGKASGLLDAETNLKYAVKYLRGAYITANRNEDQAVRFYARGYYYDAKRKGLLKVTGLRP